MHGCQWLKLEGLLRTSPDMHLLCLFGMTLLLQKVLLLFGYKNKTRILSYLPNLLVVLEMITVFEMFSCKIMAVHLHLLSSH